MFGNIRKTPDEEKDPIKKQNMINDINNEDYLVDVDKHPEYKRNESPYPDELIDYLITSEIPTKFLLYELSRKQRLVFSCYFDGDSTFKIVGHDIELELDTNNYSNEETIFSATLGAFRKEAIRQVVRLISINELYPDIRAWITIEKKRNNIREKNKEQCKPFPCKYIEKKIRNGLSENKWDSPPYGANIEYYMNINTNNFPYPEDIIKCNFWLTGEMSSLPASMKNIDDILRLIKTEEGRQKLLSFEFE